MWVFLEKGSTTVLQFLAIIVLGRLLTPEDYGTYGIMIIFIAISDALIDSGFGGALIHKKNVLPEDINTLFVTNATFSAILYALIFVGAPFLEEYYAVPNLSLFFRVLGLVVISYAFSIVQNSMLIRDLRFRTSTFITLSAAILSTTIAIVLASLGLGIWALIIQVLSQSIIATSILWMRSKVKIGTKISKQSFKDFWNFGSNLLGAHILQSIVNNVSKSIIPKIGTWGQSGLYFQACKLNNVPVNIMSMSIDKSLFPILSKETTTDRIVKKARSINRYFITYLFPIFPLVSLVSYPLIKIVLGVKWLAATDYLEIILWSGIPLIIQSLYRNILKSLGYTRYIFIVELIKSAFLLSFILIAMNFGVLFLVWAVTIASFIGAIIWGVCLNVKANYRLLDQISDLIRPVLITILDYVIMKFFTKGSHELWTLMVLPMGYMLYLLIGTVTHNSEITTVIKLVRNKIHI